MSGVLYIPFIYSRHNAKDRSLGMGRDNNRRNRRKQAREAKGDG